MLLILLYSIILVICFDPTYNDCEYTMKTAELMELVISAYFVIEIVIRVIAKGLIFSKHSFLRDIINCIDFVLVLTIVFTLVADGIIYLSQGNSHKLRSARETLVLTKVFRALRPLRLA